MQIGFIYYPVNTLGPGKRIGIWTQGCHRNCFNCMSHTLRPFDETKERSVFSILEEIKALIENNQVDGVTISGGEPFLQKDLFDLLEGINDLGIDDILLYTGYKLEQLDESQKECLAYLSVLVDGEYIDELNDNLPLRGSSNQRVFIIDDDYRKIYEHYMQGPRIFECVLLGDKMNILGMYPKGYKKISKK